MRVMEGGQWEFELVRELIDERLSSFFPGSHWPSTYPDEIIQVYRLIAVRIDLENGMSDLFQVHRTTNLRMGDSP